MSGNGPSATHFDFSQTLIAARSVPAKPEGAPGELAEFPPKFAPIEEPEEEEIIPKPTAHSGDISIDLGALQFSEVFLLWRPWEKCKRCLTNIDDGDIVLPEESDYTCPHTHKVAYKEKVDFCMRGKGAITLRDYTTLANGNRMVHLEWCEKDPKAVERLRKKKEEEKLNSLAPTFGTGDLGKQQPII